MPKTIAFSDNEFELVTISLDVAIEELSYRVRELDASGDYEPDDIARMHIQVGQMKTLASRLRKAA